MSGITAIFNKTRKALIPYITVGYPDLESTKNAVKILEECGADIIELGIPFSDPMADGVTIQESSFKALQNGVTTDTCLETVKILRETTGIPLIFMTYFNPVLKYGIEKFCNSCSTAGVDGLIVPDLPPEEGYELESATKAHGIDLIYLLAPTSTSERVQTVAKKSRGFIYLVSIAGVTGARNSLSASLECFVIRVREVAKQPLCVGYGISTPEQAHQISSAADGVIIGSKLIQLMKTDPSLSSLKVFVQEVRTALDSDHPADV